MINDEIKLILLLKHVLTFDQWKITIIVNVYGVIRILCFKNNSDNIEKIIYYLIPPFL